MTLPRLFSVPSMFVDLPNEISTYRLRRTGIYGIFSVLVKRHLGGVRLHRRWRDVHEHDSHINRRRTNLPLHTPIVTTHDHQTRPRYDLNAIRTASLCTTARMDVHTLLSRGSAGLFWVTYHTVDLSERDDISLRDMHTLCLCNSAFEAVM